MNNYGDQEDLGTSNLPPLMDLSSEETQPRTTTTIAEASHVTCFSNQMEDGQKPQMPASSILSSQIMPYLESMQFGDSISMDDHSIMRLLMDENGGNSRQNPNANNNQEFSQETGISTDISSPVSNRVEWRRPSYGHHQEFHQISSAGPVDLDCLWNY